MKLERRKSRVYDFPLESNLDILNPEQVIIRFNTGRTIDIGSLCYLVRQETQKLGFRRSKKLNSGLLVSIDSLAVQRIKDIRYLLSYISNLIKYSGLRIETIRDRISRLIPFMYWADQNKLHDVLNNPKTVRKNIAGYINYLRERCSRNEITINSATRQQNAIITILSDLFENDELKNNLPLLKKVISIEQSTEPPCEKAQSKSLSLSEHVFDGLSSLVLDHEKYPYQLRVPNYLGFKEDSLWVFPAELWFIHPGEQNNKRKTCLGYNYQMGRLNTIDEIDALRLKIARGASTNLLLLKSAIKNISQANRDYRHSQRVHVATIAINAFIVLFVAQTGMSWSQVLNLEWSEDFVVSSTKQLFRTVKWRAHGKDCYFELPVSFMPRFKRFIMLRKYLLTHETYKYLFFSSGERGLGKPSKRKSGISGVYGVLKRIDPNLQVVTSREWRAAKSDWLIRNTDLSTTALVLQNTEQTVISSYIEGSKTQQLEEVSSFLNHFSDIVVNENNKKEKLIQGMVGQCISFGNPVSVNDNNIAESNCSEPEGCLFCDKYRIHADIIDIRKLLSFRYYVEKTSSLIDGNATQYNIINAIIARLDDLCCQI